MTTPTLRTVPRPLFLTSTALAGALLLAGCAQGAVDGGADGATAAASDVTAASTPQDPAAHDASTDAAPVTVSDPWAKATDEGMTAVFAVLANRADADLVLTGAEVDLADRTELHETVDDGSGSTVMQELEGGFTIPAAGRLELVPGGNHLMLMGLEESIEPGDAVAVTLAFSDGRTQEFEAIAKEYAGAQEDYGGTEEMDHGDHGEVTDGDH